MIKITNYLPLITKIASKFPTEYHADLIQEGYLKILEIKDKYDREKGTFETFIYKPLYFMMLDFVNNENKYSSLDEPVQEEDGNTTSKVDLIQSEEDLEQNIICQDFYKENLKQSTQIERFIKKRHYEEGMTAKQITEMYSEYTNIRDVRKIKQILRK